MKRNFYFRARTIPMIKVGEFEVEKVEKKNYGNLVVSDPCYLDYKTIPVKPGIYEAYVQKQFQYGNRISRMFAVHKISRKEQRSCFEREFEAGVDSGQMCMVDEYQYRQDLGVPNFRANHTKKWSKDESKPEGELWYQYCCEKTLDKNQVGMIPNGFVSSSGLGDGCYPVMTARNLEGLITYVEVTFL